MHPKKIILITTLLLLGGLLPAAENLLNPRSWKCSSGGTFSADGSACRIDSKASKHLILEQTIPLRSSAGTLLFSGDIEIHRQKGMHSNYSIYPELVFVGAQSAPLKFARKAGCGLGRYSFRELVAVPRGATAVRVRFHHDGTLGESTISNWVLNVAGERGEQLDAPLPAGRSLDWGKEPVVASGSHRAEIVLNGLWRFQPAHSKLNPKNPLPHGWGYINVPGTWTPGEAVGLAIAGGGELWSDTPFDKLATAYFHRKVHTPQSWANRRIFLDVEHLSAIAEISVDGKRVGTIRYPDSTLELTGILQPGKEQDLLLRVTCVANMRDITISEGSAADQTYRLKERIKGKGLTGDVVLSCRPAEGNFRSVFIQTSVERRELALQLEFSGLKQETERTVSAQIRNPDGTIVKRLPPRVIRLRPDRQGNATAKVTEPWPNPRLWHPSDPWLYRLDLTISTGDFTETIQEIFGFREFKVSGRNYLLNGKRINMRPAVFHDGFKLLSAVQVRGAIDALRQYGFNLIEIWATNDLHPGQIYFAEADFLQHAAKTGMMVIPSMPYVERGELSRRSVREEWRKRCARFIRRHRNNPAIVIWGHSPNQYNGVCDQDPNYIGQRAPYIAEENGVSPLIHDGEIATKMFRELDPTRPNFSHAGHVGEIYSANNYLSLLPIQEQEEWLSRYFKRGDQPYFAVEFGFIGGLDFKRGRASHRITNKTEDQMTEHLARFYGSDAYRKESKAAAGYNAARYTGNGDLYRPSDRFIPDDYAMDLYAQLIRRVYRSWRTGGNSGGMILWMAHEAFDQGRILPENAIRFRRSIYCGPFVPGSRGFYRPWLSLAERYFWSPKGAVPNTAGKAMLEVTRPIMAWLGGQERPGDNMDFTAKDHSFRGGEVMKKQLLLLNDSPETLPYQFTVALKHEERVLDRRTFSGEIGSAGNLHLPFEFQLPQVDRKTDATLLLEGKMGGEPLSDRFTFRIFPEEFKANPVPFALYDTEGKTRNMLENAGYSVQTVTALPAGKLLIVGRNTIQLDTPPKLDLKKFVSEGGTLLMMAHKSYGDLFRYSRWISRKVFPMPNERKISAGLDASDLADWRGHGTMIPAYPPPLPASATDYGWHWSNRGSVATTAIEKPHYGAWTALLENGFDLQYSPLLELAWGKGRVILCQLDLEDHVPQDPAASRLLANLLDYAAQPWRSHRSRRTVLLGGSARQKAILQESGLNFESHTVLPGDADLILVADGADVPLSTLEEASRNGARILVMGEEAAKRIFSAGLRRRYTFRGAFDVPDWPELRGVSASDLRWRSPMSALMFTSSGKLETGANGQLARHPVAGGNPILLTLFDPERFDLQKEPFFRFTRWRQAHALNQLLVNLGATFHQDGNFFAFRSRTEVWNKYHRGWRGKMFFRRPRMNKVLSDPGISREAAEALKPGYDDSSWTALDLPFIWQEKYPSAAEWGQQNGEAVFRRVLHVPPECAGHDLTISLGIIDDFDQTFFNGVKVGEVSKGYQIPRKYLVPGKLVKPGPNLISVRLFDCLGTGGFIGAPDSFMADSPKLSGSGLYHRDYRNDVFQSSDDPCRYYRW